MQKMQNILLFKFNTTIFNNRYRYIVYITNYDDVIPCMVFSIKSMYYYVNLFSYLINSMQYIYV